MLRPLSQTTELGGPLLQQNCSAGPRLLPPSLPLPITREPFITSSFQMPDWVSEHIWIKNPAATRTATQSSWLSRQVHAAQQASPGPAHAPRSPGALSALPPLRSLSRGPTSRCRSSRQDPSQRSSWEAAPALEPAVPCSSPSDPGRLLCSQPQCPHL